MPPDPAAIARRLSPAQKRALLACEHDLRWQVPPKGARWAMQFSTLMDTDGRWWKLTERGLLVRAELERMEAKDE